MVLVAGNMYRPVDIAVDIGLNAVFVVEQRNHRISKWNYAPGQFEFILDAGKVTAIDFSGGGGTMYSVGDPVLIGPPTLNIANPVNATAEVLTESGGVITAIQINAGGNGYDPNNLPTVTAATAGTPAILAAVVSTPWGTNGNGTTGGPGPVTGPTDNNFYNPTGIINNAGAAPDELLVCDTLHHRIKRIQLSDGATLGTIGTPGTGNNNFYRPTGIDESGTHVMIADQRNERCLSYVNGNPPTFNQGSVQPTPIRFFRPRGVQFNTTHDVFNVFDNAESVVSEYDNAAEANSGQFGTPGTDPAIVTELYRPSGGHGDLPAAGESPFADTLNNSVKLAENLVITNLTNPINTPGTANGQMYRPESAIAFTDTANYVLVANTRNHRVEVFDNTGVFKSTFGSPF